MKNFGFLLLFLFALAASSCTEDAVTPRGDDDDDPIVECPGGICP